MFRRGLRRNARSPKAISTGAWTPGDVPTADQKFWGQDEVILSGSDVDFWVDKFPSGLGNADEINNPAWNATDSDYGHDTSITFVEAGVEPIVVATAANAVSLHDGTGVTLGIAFKPTKDSDATQTLFTTHNFLSTDTGAGIIVNTSANTLGLRVADGTGTFVVNVDTAGGVIAAGNVHRLVYAFGDNGSGDDYQLWLDGTKILNGTISVTPAVGASTGDFRLAMRSPTLTWAMEGTIGECIWTCDFSLASDMAAYLETQHNLGAFDEGFDFGFA